MGIDSAAGGPVAAAVAADETLRPWIAGSGPGRLFVAFSGGVDSTVLLHALRAVAGVRALHIDHGLHPDSGKWAVECSAQAARLKVPCECHRVQVAATGNAAAAARAARYGAWRSRLRPGDGLALAHQADDQAETRLWQFLTGRTPGGMPATRPLGAGGLLRPLLGVRRREILAYARQAGLCWREDPANADLRQTRSYIRHRLMPVIEARFEDAVAALAGPLRPAPASHVAPLSVAAVGLSEIEAWLTGAGLPLPSRAVAQLQRQSAAAAHRNPCVAICPGVNAWRYRGGWHLVAAPTIDTAVEPGLESVVVGTHTALLAGTLGWREASRGLAAGQALRLLPRRGGERLRPAGRSHTKSVKALFQEHGVPPWLRPSWPLLFADGGDPLLAVPEIALAANGVVAGGLLPTWQPNVRMLTRYCGPGRPESG